MPSPTQQRFNNRIAAQMAESRDAATYPQPPARLTAEPVLGEVCAEGNHWRCSTDGCECPCHARICQVCGTRGEHECTGPLTVTSWVYGPQPEPDPSRRPHQTTEDCERDPEGCYAPLRRIVTVTPDRRLL